MTKPAGEKLCAGFSAAELFPNRKLMYVHEIARVLSLSRRHVVDLCLEGEIEGTELAATPKRTAEAHWRISSAAFDEFIASRLSSRNRLTKRKAARLSDKTSARKVAR